MTMLLGEHHCMADSDGRLTLPPELHTQLGAGLTLTRGIERCLFAYPSAEWRHLVETMRHQLSLTNRDARAFTRLLFSAAETCAPSPQGRIPLPTRLRRYAEITTDSSVVVIGLDTHLEIWNPQRWQKMKKQVEDAGAALGERLNHLDIYSDHPRPPVQKAAN